MPLQQQHKLPPRYSAIYEDETYQYRHVIVDRSMLSLIPKNRLMDECEWRALGIKQGGHWQHYLIHKPEPFVLMFRRLLKYRVESDLVLSDPNSAFPSLRIPRSASNNHPLADSTNTKNNGAVFRMSFNPPCQDLDESGFESHGDA